MSNAVDHDQFDVPMSGDVNDAEYGGSMFVLVPDAGGYEFTGINPGGIAGNGREIVIVNDNPTHSVTLPHDSVKSAVGNRFFFSDGANHVLAPYEQVWGNRRETYPGRVGWWLQF